MLYSNPMYAYNSQVNSTNYLNSWEGGNLGFSWNGLLMGWINKLNMKNILPSFIVNSAAPPIATIDDV